MRELMRGHPEGKETLISVLTTGRLHGVSTTLTPIPESAVERFTAQTDLPLFDSVLTNDFADPTRYKFAVVFVRMPLPDFTTIQARMVDLDPADFMTSDDPHFFADHVNTSLREPYTAGNLPVPYFEFDREGSLKNNQEGRHRAYLEQEAGHDTIDVLFAAKAR